MYPGGPIKSGIVDKASSMPLQLLKILSIFLLYNQPTLNLL